MEQNNVLEKEIENNQDEKIYFSSCINDILNNKGNIKNENDFYSKLNTNTLRLFDGNVINQAFKDYEFDTNTANNFITYYFNSSSNDEFTIQCIEFFKNITEKCKNNDFTQNNMYIFLEALLNELKLKNDKSTTDFLKEYLNKLQNCKNAEINI